MPLNDRVRSEPLRRLWRARRAALAPCVALCVALTSTLGVSATGCGAGTSACTFDSECGAEQRCVVGECYVECRSDEECQHERHASPDAPLCQAVLRGAQQDPLSVCAPRDADLSVELGEASCQQDADCQQLFSDSRARCSLLATCIIPAEEHAVLVTDESGRGAPGVELLWVRLEDERGEALGVAVIEEYLPADAMSVKEEATLPSPPPELDAAGTCARDPQQVEALALGGSGGSVRFAFRDERGERLALRAGWRVVVIERGEPCSEGEISDEYRVSLCVSLSGDPLNSMEQCQRQLVGTARERTTSTIRFDPSP